MYSFIFPEVQGYVSLPLSVVAGQTGRPSYHSTFQTNYNSCPLWTRICALMTHSSTVTTLVTYHHLSRHASPLTSPKPECAVGTSDDGSSEGQHGRTRASTNDVSILSSPVLASIPFLSPLHALHSWCPRDPEPPGQAGINSIRKKTYWAAGCAAMR